MIPTIFGIIFISFVIVQFVPGGPVERAIAQLQGLDQGSHIGGGGGQIGGAAAHMGDVSSRYRGAQGLDPKFIKELEKQLKERTGKGYADTKLFQAYPDVSNALANKTIDVALMPSNVAAVQMRKQPDEFRIGGQIGQPLLLAWVANRSDLEIRKFINDSLDEFRANGKLTALQIKWFGSPMDTPLTNYLPAGAV